MTEDEQALTTLIGERLRAQRQALGLSLAELAERTQGVLSKSRISNYEQGIRRMGVEQAVLLAHTLGTVTPGYLLGIEQADPWTVQEGMVVDAYRALGPEGQLVVRRALGLG